MFKKFFKWLWKLIKSFNTPKGLISLFVSFMIFCGWAMVLGGIGVFSGNTKLLAIGSSVIIFWSGPFTPMWFCIILFGWFMQKFILFDKKSMTWREFKDLTKDNFPVFYEKVKNVLKINEKERKDI